MQRLDTALDENGGGKGRSRDVLGLLDQASEDMVPGQMLLAEGFTVQDAMGAIEILDPRMDTGMETESQRAQIPFDPMRRLLPEEVIAIIDIGMACEMTWHSGHALSQTLYALLYMHELESISMQNVTERWGGGGAGDDEGGGGPPLELVGLVLRGCIMGMVKCADIVWEEFVKGNLYETEDVTTDKFGLSLLENVPVDDALQLMDNAYQWVSQWTEGGEWTDALLERLRFRITLLYGLTLFYVEPPQYADSFTHLTAAIEALDTISTLPQSRYTQHPISNPVAAPAETTSSSSSLIALQASIPSAQSAASTPYLGGLPEAIGAAFDFNLARRLQSNSPVRTIAILSVEEANKSMRDLVGDLVAVVHMADTDRRYLELQTYFLSFGRRSPTPLPFIRSLHQSVLCSRNRIFGQFELISIALSFIEETTFVPAETLLRSIEEEKEGIIEGGKRFISKELPLGQRTELFLQRLAGMLVNFLTSVCANRPRAKRKLARSLDSWREVYDEAERLQSPLVNRLSDFPTISLIPLSIEFVILQIAIESVLSGFDLDIYEPREMGSIYWTACRFLRAIVRVLEELSRAAPDPQRSVMRSFLDYFTSLFDLSQASLNVASLIDLPTTTPYGNSKELFERRLKSFLRNPRSPKPLIDHLPSWEDYQKDDKLLRRAPRADRIGRARECYAQARRLLTGLLRLPSEDTSSVLCSVPYVQSIGKSVRALIANDIVLSRIPQDEPSVADPEHPEKSKDGGGTLSVHSFCNWFPVLQVK